MAYWLMKSEPESFGIDDLKKRGVEPWSGVRNYQARNYMRDQMHDGDLAFLYHSNCNLPGLYGIMEVVGKPYPDPTQYDRKSPYFDAKAKKEEPRWQMIDVKYSRHLRRPILLAELRAQSERLKGMLLLAPGSRLSVQPVSAGHWNHILTLEDP